MNRTIKILSIAPCILVLIQISFLNFSLGNTYYLILLGFLVPLIFLGKNFKFNGWMLFFLVAAFLSIAFNKIPVFFQPYQRFAIFIIVMGLIGPLIFNNQLIKFRIQLGNMLNNSILIMVVLSFIGIAAGLPTMIGRGGFAGLFNHSMMLGPMSAIAIIVALHKAYLSGNRNKYWFFILLAAIAFVTCVAAGSRSALLGGIAGSLFFYYKLNQGKITRFVRVVLVIVSLGILSFPVWEPYTERMMEKITYSEEKGDALVTRTALWEMRIKEFRSSPWLGVGFAAVDTEISTKFQEKDGKVEPGSSWLAILSMTGILGLVPILFLVLSNIVFLIRDDSDPASSAIVGGIFFLFIVHMIAEGYALSAGSGLFFYFWLTMGTIGVMKRQQDKM